MRAPSPTLASAQLLALLLPGLALVAACLGPGTLNEEAPCASSGREVLETSCSGCHLSTRVGGARGGAPEGIDFDSDADVAQHAAELLAVVEQGAMPPTAPLSACNAALLEGYVDEVSSGACVPTCAGRHCGDDACGGACGSCDAGSSCDEVTGSCVADPCVPACEGRSCGPDGCGASCGACANGESCNDATGLCTPGPCVPACDGRLCGDDGCGATCGACAAGTRCDGAQCVGLSFELDVYPIFTAKGCAASTCHAGVRPDAGLSLRSATIAHAALVNVSSTQCVQQLLVEPGAPDASYLINKLTGVGMCGSAAQIARMPRGLGATPLTPSQLALVRDWITDGAVP